MSASASASASETVVNLPYVFHIACIPPSSRIRIVDFFIFFGTRDFWERVCRGDVEGGGVKGRGEISN